MAINASLRRQVADGALQAPPELIGIHTNMPATVPADVSKALAFNEGAPAGLSPEETSAWTQLDFFYKKGLGYAIEMKTGLKRSTG